MNANRRPSQSRRRSRSRSRSRAALVAAATAATVLALPVAAHATGAVTYDGTTLTFSGDGERDSVGVSSNETDHRLWLTTSGLSSIPAECEYGFSYQAVCPMPQRLVVRLGDGDDSVSVSNGILGELPASFPVEAYGEGGKDSLQDAQVQDGGAGDDTLAGYAGTQALHGGAGDDRLSGGLDGDQLYGDDGNDLLSGDGNKDPAADLIDGGAGDDRIEGEWSRVEKPNVPISVTLDGAANDGRAGENDNVVSIEQITTYSPGALVGSDGPDSFDLQPASDRGPMSAQGRGGDDKIVGDDDVEQIDGGPGDDYLEGGFSDDTIVGGPGRDRVFGDDTGATCWAYGSCTLPYGNDTIDVRDGEVDQVDCGIGVDTVKADPQDVLSGCENVDTGPLPQTRAPPSARAGDRGTVRRGGAAVGGLAVSVAGAKLAAALRGGLVVRVAAPGAGRVSATLARGRAQVASGSAKVRKGGAVALRLRFSKAGAKQLRRGPKRAQLTLKVRFAPRGGGAAKRASATVTLTK